MDTTTPDTAKEGSTAASPAPERKDAEGDVTMKEPEKPKTRKEVKRKTVLTPVPIQVHFNSLPADVIDKYAKLEADLQKKDSDSVARAHAKNAVEAAVYRSREKLADVWDKFSTPEEKARLTDLLTKVESWLYEEGDEETKEVYDKKLGEITSLTNPLALRAHEWDQVPLALSALQNAINTLRATAMSGDEKYSHLDKADLEKVIKECDDAQNAINPKLEEFAHRTHTSNPVFLSADLVHRTQNLTTNCNAILNKPKPAPPPTPAPTQPAAGPAPGPAPGPTPTQPSTQEPKDGEKMDTEGSASAGEKMDTSV